VPPTFLIRLAACAALYLPPAPSLCSPPPPPSPPPNKLAPPITAPAPTARPAIFVATSAIPLRSD
jgi:hypothetical protein